MPRLAGGVEAWHAPPRMGYAKRKVGDVEVWVETIDAGPVEPFRDGAAIDPELRPRGVRAGEPIEDLTEQIDGAFLLAGELAKKVQKQVFDFPGDLDQLELELGLRSPPKAVCGSSPRRPRRRASS